MSLLSLFGDFKNFARWSVRGFCLMFFGGQTKKNNLFFSTFWRTRQSIFTMSVTADGVHVCMEMERRK